MVIHPDSITIEYYRRIFKAMEIDLRLASLWEKPANGRAVRSAEQEVSIDQNLYSVSSPVTDTTPKPKPTEVSENGKLSM